MFNRYVDGLAAWTPTDPAAYRERAALTATTRLLDGSPPANESTTLCLGGVVRVGWRTYDRDREVSEYLRQIYQEQEPRFTGPVAADRHEFASPSDAAQPPEGACPARSARISSASARSSRPTSIAAARSQRSTRLPSGSGCDGANSRWCRRANRRSNACASTTRSVKRSSSSRHTSASSAIDCTVEHPIGDSDLLHIPIGLKAGFGELGRHGSIINPKLGPLFRMGSVATSIELDGRPSYRCGHREVL